MSSWNENCLFNHLISFPLLCWIEQFVSWCVYLCLFSYAGWFSSFIIQLSCHFRPCHSHLPYFAGAKISCMQEGSRLEGNNFCCENPPYCFWFWWWKYIWVALEWKWWNSHVPYSKAPYWSIRLLQWAEADGSYRKSSTRPWVVFCVSASEEH